MAKFEDLHPALNPTESSLIMDLGRMAFQIHDLIFQWRKIIENGGDPRHAFPLTAKSCLGRLLRAYTFFQENPSEMDIIGPRIEMSPKEIIDQIIEHRDVLRIFRDTNLITIEDAKIALNNLEQSFPIPKPHPVIKPFLDIPNPMDW